MPKPSGSTKREKQPMRTLANRREPARGTELGRTARLMPEHLALRVPQVEACDVELHAAGLGAQPLHDHLGFGDGLVATVAGLPVARAAPQAGDVVPSASFSRIRSVRVSLSMLDLPAFADSTRQIHRGLGAGGANAKGRGAGDRHCAADAPNAPIGLWSNEPSCLLRSAHCP